MPLSDLWSHVESDVDENFESDDDDQQSDESDDGREAAEASRDNGAAVNVLLKRKLQTAPARLAKAVKKAKQQGAGDATMPAPTYAERLQKGFFSHQYQRSYRRASCDPANDFNDVKQQFARERARCVWSFLAGLKSAVVSLFQRGDAEHILNTCIADDTSTKLRAPNAGRSIVYTVMNTFQFAYIRFTDGVWDSLHIPTPLQCLNSSKASAIHHALTSWLLVTASGPGQTWQSLGCARDLLHSVKWRTSVMIGDVLKANDAAWRVERERWHRDAAEGSIGMRLKCCNHQLCLVRKPTVLAIERLWATIVRLGHLMETHSFRRALATALVALIQEDGQFVRALAWGLARGESTFFSCLF